MFNYETAAGLSDPGTEFGLEDFYVQRKLVNFFASVSPFHKRQ